MLITVQTITDSAVDLADMRNSQFIDQSGISGTELIRYANIAYRDLYAQIILSKELYFVTSTSFSISGGQESYPLPADFYKLNGVDQAISSTNRYVTLQKFEFKERNEYSGGFTPVNAAYGNIYSYILRSDVITFVPAPTSTNIIKLWYTPEPLKITNLNQTLALPPGGDEYMSLYIASMMSAKEQQDTSAFDGKRREVIEQMRNSLKDRDAGSPHRIVDDSLINDWALWPNRGRY